METRLNPSKDLINALHNFFSIRYNKTVADDYMSRFVVCTTSNTFNVYIGGKVYIFNESLTLKNVIVN